ncbi:glycosyltransferase [Larkinella soli]|uniref:glycosyltransferase n=1 Tax=Larkinella soli TaxID=1770527 RepID=UPI000FFB3A46|nr:glycosyltransferase [Larkinella soli]
MIVLVNAINLSTAGGLTVALNFLRELRQLKPPECKVHVVGPAGCGYEDLAGENFHIHCLSSWQTVWWLRPYAEFRVGELLKKIKPDVVFTMGNFALPIRLRQVVLLHLPHLVYADLPEIRSRLGFRGSCKNRLRTRLFRRRLKYVSTLLVQTQTMRDRISRRFSPMPPIELLPNAYTQLDNGKQNEILLPKAAGLKYLICLSRYYPHKNLEGLLDLANLIKKAHKPFRIITTIDARHHPGAKKWLNRRQQESLEEIVINLGTVPAASVPGLYGQVDGLILPTLMESFTATYVDALHFQIPIFTSERDFAVEICGDCAYYFDPLSAQSMLAVLENAYQNPTEMAEKVAIGKHLSSRLPGWDIVTKSCLNLLSVG